MQPRDLKAESFASYPTEAKSLAIGHLAALQQLPLSFAPILLRELTEYDYKFPAERVAIDSESPSLGFCRAGCRGRNVYRTDSPLAGRPSKLISLNNGCRDRSDAVPAQQPMRNIVGPARQLHGRS